MTIIIGEHNMKTWDSCKKFIIYNWTELRSIVILGTIFMFAIIALMSWINYIVWMFLSIIR